MASDYKTQIPIGSVAVALARVGFRVFPALPGEKRPAVGNGVNAASMDLDRVRKWWSKGQWNVGVATGEGLVVIDCDAGKPWPYKDSAPPHGVENGADMLVVLAESHGEAGDGSWMFDTMSVRTPSGGMHFYYSLPKGVKVGNSAGKLAPWVDVRGDGGYVISPWSRLTGVGDYHPVFGWDRVVSADLGDGLSNASVTKITDRPKPIPDWLLRLIQPAKTRAQVDPSDQWASLLAQLDAPDIQGDGSRWAATALENELDQVRSAVQGDRNHALNRAAFSLGQIVAAGYLSEPVVVDELGRAALVCGLTTEEIGPTIRSGLLAGSQNPRVVSLG